MIKDITYPTKSLPGYQRLVEKTLSTPVADVNTGWEDTLVPFGALLAGAAHNALALADWAKGWADHHLEAGFIGDRLPDDRNNMQHSGARHQGFYLSDYCGEWGGTAVLADLAFLGYGDQYLEAAKQLAQFFLDKSLRWEDGTILHGDWSKLPWVDTLYYSAMPLARLYRVTSDAAYANEAVRQCLLHSKHLRDHQTGLFFHEAHQNGNRTSWSWSRGNGWVIKTFADVLAMCPPDTEGWDTLMSYYRDLAVRLMHHQHSCGLWRIVLENAESHLETSGSVMIATGLLTGVQNGWLDVGNFASVRRTLLEVDTWINDKGQLMGCQTPAGLGGWERHKLSLMGERTYGAGAYLRLCADVSANQTV